MSGDRRRFLLAGTAVVLSGCGADPDRRRSAPGTSETGRRADAEVLGVVLEVERAAAAAGSDRARGRARRVEEVLAERGADPVTVGDGPDPRDRAQALAFAIAAHQDALPKLSDEGLRSLVAGFMVATAAELAGDPPEAPGAFLAPEPPA